MDAPAAHLPRRPWRWIPTLYFGEGLPYVAVMALSVIMYKRLGVSNTDIALYTSWLYLPWVLKPLWSPVVDLFHTKRLWIVGLQLVIGAAFASIALTLPGPGFFRASLTVFWLLAFSSATHDIAADGYYLLALPPHQQAAFVGVRSTFYRLSMIAGQGGLVWLAGALELYTGHIARAWTLVFLALGALFALAALYHACVLPRPSGDHKTSGAPSGRVGYFATFATFFRKPRLGVALAFFLLFRLGEAQLVKLSAPFMLDPRAVGGLGLTTQDVGLIYGTVGVAALTIGGLVGGYLVSRHGLKAWIWPMLAAMHLPNLIYVAFAYVQPASHAWITAGVAVEQFGYGFGFTAYLLYMMRFAEGESRTAHYAICTGFMALGMMLPGMAAGWIQEHVGYSLFFVWVCLATLPSLLVATRLGIDPSYGRKAPHATNVRD